MNRSDEIMAEASRRAAIGPFSDPGLEQAYQRDYFRLTIRTVRAALALAIGLFLLFALLDPWLVDGDQMQLRMVRLAVVCPILLVLFIWTYARTFPRYLVLAQVIAVLVGGSAIIYMGTLGGNVVAEAQYIGLVLAVMWTHSVSRLPFRVASGAALALSFEYVFVELSLDRLGTTALVNYTFLLASANLIGMIASYHLEAGFRRDFQQRRLLDQRRRELEASMNQLHDAEQRVSELESLVPDTIENLPRWAEQIAGEIRRTVSAAEVRVWRCVNGEPVALTDGELSPPTRDQVGASGQMTTDTMGNVIVPLSGISGELFGVIVIAAPATWSAHERRLVGGFARYLGGALETLEKRQELAQEQERREGARRQMQERGVGAMWLCPTCGRCFDDTADRCDVDQSRLVPRLLPYRVQGRYQLVRLLGQGGMGQVFLACDERLQRDVAIKVLHGEAPLDAATRAQLAHEARAVARIGHPGVVDVFDLGHLDDGSAFIVMEYLTGRALSEEIARHGRGAPQQVATLVRQVSAALGAAHRTGVVHRDIKPQNVYLTRVADGFQARLLDFGVARVAGAGAAGVNSGGVMGTPAYMAPEQINGAEGDERSDLYSLAAVVYEALVGHRLIRPRGSMAATLAAVVNEPLPVVSSSLAGAPVGLDGLFCSALSRDPGKRPTNLAAWSDKVAGLLDQMPSTTVGWPLPITHELKLRDDTPSTAREAVTFG